MRKLHWLAAVLAAMLILAGCWEVQSPESSLDSAPTETLTTEPDSGLPILPPETEVSQTTGSSEETEPSEETDPSEGTAATEETAFGMEDELPIIPGG